MSALPSTRRRERGQALVETAIILPVFLMCLFGVVDMGRAIWATTSLASAAREAARYAIVHGGTASQTCPVGKAGADSPATTASASCPYPADAAGSANSKQSIVDAASTAAIAGGTNIAVTVCYGSGCSGNTDTVDNSRGQTVTVVASSTVNLIVPALLGRSSFNLSGSSTMVVNH